jgi:hypothetical protein
MRRRFSLFVAVQTPRLRAAGAFEPDAAAAPLFYHTPALSGRHLRRRTMAPRVSTGTAPPEIRSWSGSKSGASPAGSRPPCGASFGPTPEVLACRASTSRLAVVATAGCGDLAPSWRRMGAPGRGPRTSSGRAPLLEGYQRVSAARTSIVGGERPLAARAGGEAGGGLPARMTSAFLPKGIRERCDPQRRVPCPVRRWRTGHPCAPPAAAGLEREPR